MIILDTQNKTFQISLIHEENRNEIPWTCCYKNFTPGKQGSEIYITITGLSNGTSNVIVIPGPKPGTVNELIIFSIVNNDNGRNVVSINIYDGSIYTPILYSVLRPGRTLFYPRDRSFLLYSTSGVS